MNRTAAGYFIAIPRKMYLPNAVGIALSSSPETKGGGSNVVSVRRIRQQTSHTPEGTALFALTFACAPNANESPTYSQHIPRNGVYCVRNLGEGDQAFIGQAVAYAVDKLCHSVIFRRGIEFLFVLAQQQYFVTPNDEVTKAAAFPPNRREDTQTTFAVSVESPSGAGTRV